MKTTNVESRFSGFPFPIPIWGFSQLLEMGFAMAFPMAIKVEGGVNDPRLGPIDVRSKCRTCDEGGASFSGRFKMVQVL